MFGAESFPKVSTGTDLVTSSSNAMMTTNSPGTLSRMSPMESVQELFVSMANSLQAIVENTTQTNELLKGTDAQRRDKNIGDSDTDGDKDISKGKGPSALDKLKGIFSKLNPFSDGGPGPIGTAIIAGLGLLGLNMFGDDAQKGIENLLNSIKNGKIGEMLSNFGDSIKEQFTRLKKMLGSIITGITEYINKFDIDNSGTLDSDELDLLLEDLKERAVDLISGFMGSLFDALKVSILGSIFLGTAVKSLINNPALKGIFGSGKGFIGPRPPVPGIGIAGGLGIAALIAYGVTATYDNFQKSMKKTLDENGGEFGMGDFVANFLGGKNDGGVMNAFTKAFQLGGTGALAGMAIGAIGGPPGMIIGGLLGLATGALLGGVTGFLGSDKIKTMTDKFSDMISNTVDVLDGFFTGITESIRKAITGEATSFELDEQANLDAIAKEEAMIKKLLGEGRSEDSYAITRRRKNIEKYKKNISEITPEKIAQRNRDQGDRLTQGQDSKIANAERGMADAERRINTFLSMTPEEKAKPENYFESRLAKARKDYAGAEILFKDAQMSKKIILEDLNIDYEIPPAKNAIKEATDNINGMGRSNAPGGNIIANNNNITDNSTKVVANAPGGNDFNPYPSDVERMLNRLNGMGVA